MILLKDLKLGMCQFCGDTRGTDSTLYTDVGATYANYAIRDIEQEVRKRCKVPDFFHAEFVIDTAVSGVLGDYALPLDFAAVVSKFAGRAVMASGRLGPVDGVPLVDFAKHVSDGQYARSTVWTIHGKAPQRYIRFTPAPLDSGVTFTLAYQRKQAKLISDNDPITIFPEDDGWEQIIIFRMAGYAIRFHQAVFKGDPDVDYKKALADKIDSLNADMPQTNGEVGHMDDHAMMEMDIERGRCSLRGSL
jgi:hypothetical protein